MTKFVYMLNNDSDMLDGILEVGENSMNMKAIGLEYSSINKKVKVTTKKFVLLRRRLSSR